jgi:hypothetical protein
MNARTSKLQATIVKPEQAPPIKPFGLDMKVLLSTEATGGAISLIMAYHEPCCLSHLPLLPQSPSEHSSSHRLPERIAASARITSSARANSSPSRIKNAEWWLRSNEMLFLGLDKS